MSILKASGQTFGMVVRVRHAGPQRDVHLVAILSRSSSAFSTLTGSGHPDPTTIPSLQWFWQVVRLGAVLPGQVEVSEYAVQWPNAFPRLDPGVYDVHRVIIDPLRVFPETNAQAYNRSGQAGPRDWDDDVYEVVAPVAGGAAAEPVGVADWATSSGSYF